MKRIKRVFDSKPIAAHLYVTEKCNLRCSYCTEFDNSVPHPSLETIKMWIDKLEELGCIRIGIQGGEPLLHPDIVRIVEYIKSKAMGCSMSTNALLLTPELVKGFEDAGLDSIHVSIDRMTENEDTKKCVKKVNKKLECLKGTKIGFHVTGVLYGGSIEELPGVFDYASSIGAQVKAHLIHTGTAGKFTVDPGEKKKLESFIDWEIDQKKKGRSIRTGFNVLKYQKALLNEKFFNWKCIAGYKYLFVSAKGKLWICSMLRKPEIDIMDVTPEMLKKNDKKKFCQDGCGVYCVVGESLANNNPLKFIGLEAAEYIKGLPSRLKPRTSRIYNYESNKDN